MYRCFEIICCLLLTSNLSAQYIYEANQDLYDLQTNSSGSTGLGSNDDSVSAAFDLGFTFTFYGNDFTKARMATNGCLHFNLTGSYCGDYTPDPLPQYTNTLFVFWTDLIKDNGSAMRAKAFDDYTIFGWYKMREYNRSGSDNSIEVWLYPNNTFEYRYGELDIKTHDVLIGEQGPTTSDIYTYLFFDECNTGTTNISGTCVSYDWNSSSNAANTLLENGGSLYGVGVGQSLCITSPLTSVNCAGYAAAYLVQQCALNSLYDEDCDGYAAAYLTQQCNVSQLYSQECPNYWSAYDDQQCDDDPQYGPFCAGYSQQESVAYFDETYIDYGYEESMTQYDTFNDDYQEYDTLYNTFEDEMFFEPIFIEDDYDIFYNDFESFETNSFVYYPQEEEFEMLLAFENFEDHTLDPVSLRLEDELLEEFLFQETILLENFEEPETFIEFETVEELDEWFEEETQEEIVEEEAEEEVVEEEIISEAEEESLEEESLTEEEGIIEEGESKSSITREMALAVVTSTIQTAKQSIHTTVHGNTSTNVSSNSSMTGSGMSSSASASSTGSVSNSPSISEQFSSSTAQTNQILDMSATVTATTTSTSTVNSNIGSVTSTTFSSNTNTTTNKSIQNQIDVSVSNDTGDTDTEQLVSNLIAKNLEQAKEDVEVQQQETGEYGSEDTIIAYMGFVPNFNTYRTVYIPTQDQWYESQSIYAGNKMIDNIEGFYQMAGQSLNTLTELKKLQPNL